MRTPTLKSIAASCLLLVESFAPGTVTWDSAVTAVERDADDC